jgi:hypothetical protein
MGVKDGYSKYTYVHTYIYTYIHTYTHTYIIYNIDPVNVYNVSL